MIRKSSSREPGSRLVIMRMRMMRRMRIRMIRKMVEFFERARLKVGHHEDGHDHNEDRRFFCDHDDNEDDK